MVKFLKMFKLLEQKVGIMNVPDERGYFGIYGGRFVPETLMAALDELTKAYELYRYDEVFQEDSLEKKKEYIIQYQADILVMGDDWYGKFDELNSICKVIYLTRTADISSTALKERIRYTI